MQLTHQSRSEPHPINLHLEFLRRTSCGDAVFTVKDIKLGSRISNLHITLSQKQSNGKVADEVEGYITMSNLASESGLTLPTEYKVLPAPLPANLASLAATGEDENYALRRNEPYPKFRRAGQHAGLHLVRPDRRPSNMPKSIIDQWTRFRPYKREGRWTNDALGFVVDLFPQIVECYLNARLEDAANSNQEISPDLLKNNAGAPFWYPTLTLNLDIKKLLPPEGANWLFVRVHAKAILNGRLDLNIEVFDEANELVALSSHASLVLDASRNLRRGQAKV